MSSSDVESVRSGGMSRLPRAPKPTALPRAGEASSARVPSTSARPASATRVPSASSHARRGAASSASNNVARRDLPAPTLPRQPLSVINARQASVGRKASGLSPKGKVAANVGRRDVAGTRRASGGRMSALENQFLTMKDLFERERQNTAEVLAREQAERARQEDKVKALEAQQAKLPQGARGSGGDGAEYEELVRSNAKLAKEKRLLEEALESSEDALKRHKGYLRERDAKSDEMSLRYKGLEEELSSRDQQIRDQQQALVRLEEETARLRTSTALIEEELRAAETLRRKLHNEVQELRGNIRVFARVRPQLPRETNSGLASIAFPDPREAACIELQACGESAVGTATLKTHGFKFDRVFQPSATQEDVFEEVAHLTQSVLDGYNTCIFAYGQTGSGKTHSLEGSTNLQLGAAATPTQDPEAGLIPRAVQMLWSTAESLRDKGWRYEFEGQMLEIYNDEINDLLAKGETSSGKAEPKHEIKHEKTRTFVSDTIVVPLVTPSQVFNLLAKAKSRRQTAATLMNERSSRSHCVFILRVKGANHVTGESCDATLSLVDLAGSERVNSSGADKDPVRFTETKSINKSLSSLNDVISALGNQKAGSHVPYRNSTLTWLLKNSLGGNSKTLMLLAISPMAEHLNETINSLRFASKVNSTVIGTARRVRASE